MQKILLIDNYDSFSHMLADYFLRLSVDLEIVRNDDSALDEALSECGAIVISPGPGTPEKAGRCIPIIQKYYASRPIFGVCLGFQAIGSAFGAQTKPCPPQHGRASAIRILKQDDPLFRDMQDGFSAGRYHSLGVFDLPETLEILAIEPESGLPMAIKKRDSFCYGVQFHPESLLTEGGETLIRNFVKIAGGAMS